MAQADSASSIEELFETTYRWMCLGMRYHRSSFAHRAKQLKLGTDRQKVVWGDAHYSSRLQLFASDRDSFKAVNGGELPALLNRYLEKKGFGIEALGNDSTWPVKYRSAYLVSKGRLQYEYIYETSRKRQGGWSGCLYMLYRDEAVNINHERPEDVFHAVLQWVEKREQPSSEFSLFNLQFKEHKYKLEFGGRKYKYRLFLSFRYNNRDCSGTPNGFFYYKVMPALFMHFLEGQGYELEVIQDMSQPSWSRTLYAASKKRHKPFRFYYEAENALRCGGARVFIID